MKKPIHTIRRPGTVIEILKALHIPLKTYKKTIKEMEKLNNEEKK